MGASVVKEIDHINDGYRKLIEMALTAYLDREIGTRRRVLVESRALGRTEQFVPVRLAAPVEPGVILDLAIKAHDGRQLLAA